MPMSRAELIDVMSTELQAKIKIPFNQIKVSTFVYRTNLREWVGLDELIIEYNTNQMK